MKSYPFILLCSFLVFSSCKDNKKKEFDLAIHNVKITIQPNVYKGENTALLEIPLNMEETAKKEQINYNVIYNAYLTKLSVNINSKNALNNIESVSFEAYNSLRKPTKIANLDSIAQQNNEAFVIKNNDLGDFFQDNSLFLLSYIHFKEADSNSFEMTIDLNFKLLSEKQKSL